MKNLVAYNPLNFNERQREIAKLAAAGYHRKSICKKLGLSKSVTDKAFETLYNKLGISAFKGEISDFQPSVLLANRVNEYLNAPLLSYTAIGQSRNIDFNVEGFLVSESIHKIRTNREVSKIAWSYGRGLSKPDFSLEPENPEIKIEVSDVISEDNKRTYKGHIEIREKTARSVRYFVEFTPPIPKDQNIQYTIKISVADAYHRTTKDLHDGWSKVSQNSGFEYREFKNLGRIWHTYNVRGPIRVNAKFPPEYPITHLRACVYSRSWDRLYDQEEKIRRMGLLRVNTVPVDRFENAKITNFEFLSDDLINCNLVFLWKPLHDG